MQDSEQGFTANRERASGEGSDVAAKRRSRRRWSAEEKARIVRESLRPGTRVEDVAWRYGLTRKQLSAWRSFARQDKLAVPSWAQPWNSRGPVGPLSESASRCLATRSRAFAFSMAPWGLRTSPWYLSRAACVLLPRSGESGAKARSPRTRKRTYRAPAKWGTCSEDGDRLRTDSTRRRRGGPKTRVYLKRNRSLNAFEI